MEGARRPRRSIVKAAGTLSSLLRPHPDLFCHWLKPSLPDSGAQPAAERPVQERDRTAAGPELETLGGQGQHPVGGQNLHSVQGHVAAVPVPSLEHYRDRGGVNHGGGHVAPC